jgi:DNA-directed RNA polymerase subunit beta'
MLLREIQERPVLINRAPTLHRYNIVAATPRPVIGKTLRVNPFIEKGFNLDYDGDAIQIHVPISNKAIQDAEAMKLSNIIFGDKSKQDLLVFPQHEAIMGINHMSSLDDKNKPKIYKTDAEAMKDYSEGKIGLGTHVKIEEKKK